MISDCSSYTNDQRHQQTWSCDRFGKPLRFEERLLSCSPRQQLELSAGRGQDHLLRLCWFKSIKNNNNNNNNNNWFLYSTKYTKGRLNTFKHICIQYFLKGTQMYMYMYVVLRWNYEIYSFYIAMLWFARCCGAVCCQSSQENRGEAFLFSISAQGSFMCFTKDTGPTTLGPIWWKKQ